MQHTLSVFENHFACQANGSALTDPSDYGEPIVTIILDDEV